MAVSCLHEILSNGYVNTTLHALCGPKGTVDYLMDALSEKMERQPTVMQEPILTEKRVAMTM